MWWNHRHISNYNKGKGFQLGATQLCFPGDLGVRGIRRGSFLVCCSALSLGGGSQAKIHTCQGTSQISFLVISEQVWGGAVWRVGWSWWRALPGLATRVFLQSPQAHAICNMGMQFAETWGKVKCNPGYPLMARSGENKIGESCLLNSVGSETCVPFCVCAKLDYSTDIKDVMWMNLQPSICQRGRKT